MSLIEDGRVGKNMIACVDADYDYLGQGATKQSDVILSSPYIVHTNIFYIRYLH